MRRTSPEFICAMESASDKAKIHHVILAELRDLAHEKYGLDASVQLNQRTDEVSLMLFFKGFLSQQTQWYKFQVAHSECHTF